MQFHFQCWVLPQGMLHEILMEQQRQHLLQQQQHLRSEHLHQGTQQDHPMHDVQPQQPECEQHESLQQDQPMQEAQQEQQHEQWQGEGMQQQQPPQDQHEKVSMGAPPAAAAVEGDQPQQEEPQQEVSSGVVAGVKDEQAPGVPAVQLVCQERAHQAVKEEGGHHDGTTEVKPGVQGDHKHAAGGDQCVNEGRQQAGIESGGRQGGDWKEQGQVLVADDPAKAAATMAAAAVTAALKKEEGEVGQLHGADAGGERGSTPAATTAVMVDAQVSLSCCLSCIWDWELRWHAPFLSQLCCC